MRYNRLMPEHMSIAEYLKTAKGARRTKNKFNAQRTTQNGRVYDSAKEAAHARDLELLKYAGEVVAIEEQVPFPCVVNDVPVCTYVADFRITYADGRVEVHDVKGYKKGAAYAQFRLKKKLVLAVHGVHIIEV